MQREQPCFAAFEFNIAVDEVYLTGADAFDFRAGQSDAGLQKLGKFVEMTGLFVDGNGGRRCFLAHG